MATNNAVNVSLAGQTGSGNFVGSGSPTITTPRIALIHDSSGNPCMGFANGLASPDFLTSQSITGQPELQATGSTTNINLLLRPKGTGILIAASTATNIPLSIYNGTAYQHLTNFSFSNTSATRTVTFPDASGTVAFTSTAITQIVPQPFSSSGTYTPTPGMKYCIIECWGGGGGGGGANNSGATGYIIGGTGGSGSYSRIIASAADIGASKAVTIGAGGSGGTAGANAGTNGSATSVGTLCVANGGSGGGGGQAAGGLGGTAGTGTIAGTGEPGLPGIASVINSISVTTSVGGSSLIGGGGIARVTAGTGNAATGYGGGGGAGLSVNAGGAQAGGAGTAGFVLITEFI